MSTIQQCLFSTVVNDFAFLFKEVLIHALEGIEGMIGGNVKVMDVVAGR